MEPEKEITIYDLARELQLSSATVSRALKDDPVVSSKTRKRIFELAEQMGYRTNHFARNLRNRRTETIGVIVPSLNSYFMSTVIAGIEKVVNEAGYSLIISQSSESVQKEKQNARTLFNNRVDGLLVSLAFHSADLLHFEPFLKRAIPLLFFDRVAAHERCTSVRIDNRKAAYEATCHLIEQGRRRIAHITADSRTNVYRDRLAGYRQALKDHGLAYREGEVLLNSLSLESGAEAAERIRRLHPLPDAVFAASDHCAVGCMVALKGAGLRLPDDLAFVGFNNDPVSTVIEPNLSTINYPGYQMGEVAARNLIQQLTGAAGIQVKDDIILRSELLVRASSMG